MTDMTTDYMGLTLKNPLVPSASPLTKNLADAKALEDAGSGAIIMHSLFEEEIENHQKIYLDHLAEPNFSFAEMDHFLPQPMEYQDVASQYLQQVEQLKKSLDIPVIASMNGTAAGEWLEIAGEIESAGADALELNLYNIPTDFTCSSVDIEKNYLKLFSELKANTHLPITLKLTDQFSSLGNFIQTLADAGAEGVSLFNRFYQPDIDLETGHVYASLKLSSRNEYFRSLHWIALLYNKVDLCLGATGGVHSAETALKLIGAGADVVHTTSSLLSTGPSTVSQWLREMNDWLEEHEYSSPDDFRGKYSFWNHQNQSAYERLNYYQNLQLFHR